MYNRYNYRNNPRFGQIGFRQGQTRAIGLPLDVIDKVGAGMTASYHRNRQAYANYQSKVLELPDANSDVNKRIIEQISDEVKTAFSDYHEEGNWWNADDAVYDMLDTLTSDVRIKDLQTYAAQAAKVQNQIDEANTSQYWKNLAHAYNQKLNKGIRAVDENGNITNQSLTYQGQGISDINLQEKVKIINELVKDWKADYQESQLKGSGEVFTNFKTTEGYQNLVMMYGKEAIESVPYDEIESFVTSFVLSDPSYQAELDDVARLTAFARSGGERLEPNAEDVVSLMGEVALRDKNTMMSIIYNSPEFLAATSDMEAKDKFEYYNKVTANPENASAFLQSGMASTMKILEESFKDDPQAYKDAYKGLIRNQQWGLFEGIIKKASYSKYSFDIKYDDLGINTIRYKKFIEDNVIRYPTATPGGQIDFENLSVRVDKKEELANQIAEHELQIQALASENDNGKNDLAIRRLNTELNNLKAEKNTTDLYIEDIKLAHGITDNDIYNISRGNLENRIKSVSNLDYNESGVFIPEYDKEDAEIIYDIILESNGDVNIIKEEMAKNGLRARDKDIQGILRTFESVYNNNLSDIIKDSDIPISSPYEYIGYRGGDNVALNDWKNAMIEQYLRFDGTMNIIESNFEGRAGTNNMLDKKSDFTSTHLIEKAGNKLYESNIISIKPVMFRKNNGRMAFEITMVDPTNNTPTREIVEVLTTDDGTTQDYFNALARDVAKAAIDDKNPFHNQARKDAGKFVTFPITLNEVKSINGKNITGENLAQSINAWTESPTNNRVITFNYNGADVTYVGEKLGDGIYKSSLYAGSHTGSPREIHSNFSEDLLESDSNSTDAFKAIEKFGAREAAIKAYSDYNDIESVEALNTIFNLKLNNKSK